MTRHALAILPRATHYDIDVDPALARSVAGFLDDASVPRGNARSTLRSPDQA